MKNWEKYEKEIKEIGLANLAVTKTGEVKSCFGKDNIDCDICRFAGYKVSERQCYLNMTDWLYEEYKEPEIDWTEVAVDTPIYVRNRESDDWKPRHFAKYENGKVFVWAHGTTSFSTHYKSIASWECAKLAEDANERD